MAHTCNPSRSEHISEIFEAGKIYLSYEVPGQSAQHNGDLMKNNHSRSIGFLPVTSTTDLVDLGSDEDLLLMW